MLLKSLQTSCSFVLEEAPPSEFSFPLYFILFAVVSFLVYRKGSPIKYKTHCSTFNNVLAEKEKRCAQW